MAIGITYASVRELCFCNVIPFVKYKNKKVKPIADFVVYIDKSS